MASSSVSSTVIPPKDKYDVFLNFRSSDTRQTFTSHLHAALIRRKVETFIDYRLERGNEVGPALLKAIEESKISVIIFSKDYASSEWCLDELVYILECREKHGRHVIPIFYEIDPSHVNPSHEEFHTGSYATALAKYERRLKDETDEKDKTDKTDETDEKDKTDKTDKTDEKDKTNKTDEKDKTNMTDETDEKDKTNKTDETDEIDEKDKTNKTDKVAKWKKALVKAATISGSDSASRTVRDDADLVEQTVRDVLDKLNRESSSDLTGLIGAEVRIKKILLELDIIPEDVRVRFVVIWGMGGIGKTTLADAVYHGLSSQFEAHCFLANVRARSSGSTDEFSPGLYLLRNELLGKLLPDESLAIHSRTVGAVDKERLRRTKVLVVLEDVNDSSQLTFLAGEVQFGQGSRIIVTTRDKETLPVKKVADHDVKIYEVEKLNGVESLQLFHSNAATHCTENPEFLEKQVVDRAAGIPRVLKYYRSQFLQCKIKEEKELLWDQLEKFPNKELQKIYRASYDGLESNVREIFLDIACFHEKEKLCEAKRMMGNLFLWKLC